MTWHADVDSLRAYAAGATSEVAAASIEAHTVTCSTCRAVLSGLADRARLDQIWMVVADRVDQPRTTWLERLLRRVGVPEGLARLVIVTPSLRLPWLSAVVGVLLLSALAVREGRGDNALFVFLVAAPLLPVAGVALAFGPHADAIHELTMAAPVRKLDLLLARAAAVVLATTAITAIGTLALGRDDWSVVVWLLPSLALTAGALACSTWVPAPWAAGALSFLWVSAALAFVLDDQAALTLAASPTPLAERRGVRIGAGVALAAIWWSGLLAVFSVRVHGPRPWTAPTLEFALYTAVGLAASV